MFANKGTFCSLLRQWCIKGLNQGTLHYYLFFNSNSKLKCPSNLSKDNIYLLPYSYGGVFVTPFSCHHLMKALFLQLIFITIQPVTIIYTLLFVLTALHFYYPLFLAIPFTSFTLVIMTCVHPLSVARMVKDRNSSNSQYTFSLHFVSEFHRWTYSN